MNNLLDPVVYPELKKYLQEQYAGVFDESMVNSLVSEYIDDKNSTVLANDLVADGHFGRRMLDIGSGYGSNVLASRQAGIDAIGIEIAPFEVEFARKRLRQERPDDSPDNVYLLGSALHLPFQDDSFDLITIMNVLEHVTDYRRLLSEAVRVLRPNGALYIVCPNYAAFRREAHYQVPWLPLLNKDLAGWYLKAIGRNPQFLKMSIHYCTNWGILRCLSQLQVRIVNPQFEKLRNISAIRSKNARTMLLAVERLGLMWIAKWLVAAQFYNPCKASVRLTAVKQIIR